MEAGANDTTPPFSGRQTATNRPNSHRRPALHSARAALIDWYTQPFDYEWTTRHRSIRGLHQPLQYVFGSATTLYAVASILMLFSSRGPHGFGAQAWISIVLLMQVAVALRWFFGPLPVKRDFIAYAIFGDAGTASVLVLYSPFGALVGSSLFALTGGLCIFFVSQKWMLAHLALCCSFIAAMTVRNLLAADEDAPTVLATALVILAATAVVPLLAHIAWTAIGRDARRSLLDPLTNLLNRRGLDDAAEALWHRGHGRGFSLTVLVVDIDRFKVVNDYYGHDSGDAVIVRVADRLSLLFQENGVVARTGGEEFVTVFAAPNAEVHQRIEDVVDTLYNSSDHIPITVSVGACVLASPSSLWVDGPSVINKAGRIADSMMYRAKLDGGNRSSTTKL